MNVHEYQAKDLLRRYGLTTVKGAVVTNSDEALKAAQTLGGSMWVVKAQIHAGGRGKGGGVKVTKSISEVPELTKKMIGMTLVTHQTGPEGKEVRKVLIEQGCAIKKEYYVASLVDRASSRVVLMASSEGGMDIEEVAAHHPEKIHRVLIDPAVGMMPFQGRQLAFAIGMEGAIANKGAQAFVKLYEAFIGLDCSMAEINPLVETNDGEVIVLDAKLNFDANSLFRHPNVSELRDLHEEDPSEIEASQYDLAFIKLNGNIGCLVNGAGLAMATMDIIKINGGEPANFLDVGGGANKEKVTAAFKIILRDPNVKGILVNIFGGIMKCDIIAEGIIAATKDLGLRVPLVVRLQGTNVEEGKRLLKDSGLNIIPADALTEAAQKIVTAVTPQGSARVKGG